ncbi:hypothetical protein PFISCL1PPCAC_17679, partial [Pristionchus fissidentatus]
SECGDYDEISDPGDATKPCFKTFTDPMNWNDAQKKCSDDFGSLATINSEEVKTSSENTYSYFLIYETLFCLAHQSADGGSWDWIDGTRNSSGYANFVGGFPLPGGGQCTGMLTESSSAKWTNEDCDNQKLPFICRR